MAFNHNNISFKVLQMRRPQHKRGAGEYRNVGDTSEGEAHLSGLISWLAAPVSGTAIQR